MLYLALLALTLFSDQALSSPAEEPPDNSIPILETAQELFGTRANFAANRLDSFFATERADDEFGRSRIRTRTRFTMTERAVSELDNQYRINLKLPHLEQRFRYDYYQDDKDKKKKVNEEDKKKKDKKNKDERDLLAKDQLNTSWIFNSDVGVSAAIPPKLVTRARARKSFVTGSLIHRFVEQLTYATGEDGLIQDTELNTDQIYNQDQIFRFINTARWRILEKEFTTNHGPTFLHRITEDDAFNYGFLVQTIIENSPWYVHNYSLTVNYRRNVYRQWVYFDVIPGLNFPKEWSFRRTPFVIFQLELLFGG